MCNTIGNIFRLCILGGVALALTMQFLVTFGCDFLDTTDGSVGIWYIDEDGSGTCVDWDTSEQEALAAQSALTISTVFGFGAGALVLLEWVCCEICCAGCVEGLAFAASWMMGGCVFVVYGIEACGNFSAGADANLESDCVWSTEATYMTVACAAYFFAGFILCCAPQPDPICQQ